MPYVEKVSSNLFTFPAFFYNFRHACNPLGQFMGAYRLESSLATQMQAFAPNPERHWVEERKLREYSHSILINTRTLSVFPPSSAPPQNQYGHKTEFFMLLW